MSKENRKNLTFEVAKKDGDSVDTITCPSSGKEIYYLSSSGNYFAIDSFGFCVVCKKAYHISNMRSLDGMDHCSWPVEYEGLTCRSCYQGPSQDLSVDSVKLKLDDPYDGDTD